MAWVDVITFDVISFYLIYFQRISLFNISLRYNLERPIIYIALKSIVFLNCFM